ncbi:hypothetical protein RhiLY_11720 [Ceratobasidium sp. AG-Ba]|nr:hypothetical protein RhiLY_11720 [Ceratobasidium sp. AG-Ba]
MSRKANEANQPSLAASRARRPNAGVPPEAFDSVAERIERRNKQAAIHAKAAVASKIESNPYNGDDLPERDPLEAFRAPTPTGDPSVDEVNWERARVKWLISFLAHRDGVDVRPSLHARRIGLPELEEIHDNPEAAQDLLTFDEHDPNPADKEKGKQPAVPSAASQHVSKHGPPQVQTNYAGISVDSEDYTIRAKHGPKLFLPTPGRVATSSGVKRKFEQGPGSTSMRCEDRVDPHSNIESNMHGLWLATAGQAQASLRRTDSTTVLDAPQKTRPIAGPKAVQHGSNPPPPPASASHASKLAPQNPPPTQGQPPSKKPRMMNNPGPVQVKQRADAQVGPNHSYVDNTGNPASVKSRHRVPNLLSESSGVVNGQPPQANQAADATRLLQGPALAMAPDQEVLCLSPTHADHEVLEVNKEIDGDSEQNAAPSEKTVVTKGKATIKSFAADEQPIVERMSKLAKAYIIANGPYDDSPIELTTQYNDWPEDWVPHASRLDLVSKCLEEACNEYDVVLRFIPQHVKCVTELVRTHHTGAADRIKPLVDHAFGFTLEKSDHNKTTSKALLPFNFHYRDTKRKRGPLENAVIAKACRAAAFQKASAVGPKNDRIFDATPVGYLAYTCAMIHYVIWAYRSGEFSNENLDADIQGAAFRRALRFLISMHQNKARQLENIRYNIYDQCMTGFEPKSTVRDPTPEPEREWTPDTEEQYIRRYKAGHNRADDLDSIGVGGPEDGLEN